MNNEERKIIEEQIGYTFKNSDLLQQAFVRKSYSQEHGGENNEVLEFIGDKALDFVVVKMLAEMYGSFSEDYDDYNPNEDCNEFISKFQEGKLTEIKKNLVKRATLSERIDNFGFSDYLIMGKGDINNNAENQESVKEDLFEAIIGAVALDSNWNINAMEDVVDIMLSPESYINPNKTSYNDRIQKWVSKKYSVSPRYHFEKASQAVWYIPFDGISMGFDYSSRWEHICLMKLGGLDIIFRAFGKTKKEARENVCKLAYDFLDSKNMLITLIDEVGEPSFERAINQLQELSQKGYIGEVWYDFNESHDEDGNSTWRCECHIEGEENYYWIETSSKKQGKKRVAYDMLCYILDLEDDDES